MQMDVCVLIGLVLCIVPREYIEDFLGDDLKLAGGQNPLTKGLRGVGVAMKRGTTDNDILNNAEFEPYIWDSFRRLYKQGQTHFLVHTWKEEGDERFAEMLETLREPDGQWRWDGSVSVNNQIVVRGITIKNTHNRLAVWRF